MRVMVAAILAMTASGAVANELEDAHRLALQGRDSYWNDYLSMQFPDTEAGAHMTTANKAIELAQKDIVTAFVRHRAPK